jgi:hypothetical protein
MGLQGSPVRIRPSRLGPPTRMLEGLVGSGPSRVLAAAQNCTDVAAGNRTLGDFVAAKRSHSSRSAPKIGQTPGTEPVPSCCPHTRTCAQRPQRSRRHVERGATPRPAHPPRRRSGRPRSRASTLASLGLFRGRARAQTVSEQAHPKASWLRRGLKSRWTPWPHRTRIPPAPSTPTSSAHTSRPDGRSALRGPRPSTIHLGSRD